MRTSLCVDHIVVTVSDLAAAVQDYQALGFTVTPGGTHTSGASHNALIVFQDGSYLELLAFADPAVIQTSQQYWANSQLSVTGEQYARNRFLVNAGKGEGLTDFALLAPDARALYGDATYAGLALADPVSGGRQNPDGAQMAWTVIMPHSPALPFIIADDTPRSLRVPEGAARTHANGVTGIAGIVVAVSDVAQSLHDYAALLGVPLKSPVFDVGGTSITLAALHGDIRQHGVGPAEVSLRSSADQPDMSNLSLTHGARLRLAAA